MGQIPVSRAENWLQMECDAGRGSGVDAAFFEFAIQSFAQLQHVFPRGWRFRDGLNPQRIVF